MKDTMREIKRLAKAYISARRNRHQASIDNDLIQVDVWNDEINYLYNELTQYDHDTVMRELRAV